MLIKSLNHPVLGYCQSLIISSKSRSLSRFHSSYSPPSLLTFRIKTIHRGVKTSCIRPGQELIFDENSGDSISLSKNEEKEEAEEEEDEEDIEIEVEREGLENQSIWSQMKEILMFTGPATGLWICGPLMSLIDTAVIGQGSSIELAALGIHFLTFVGFLYSAIYFFVVGFAEKNYFKYENIS